MQSGRHCLRQAKALSHVLSRGYKNAGEFFLGQSLKPDRRWKMPLLIIPIMAVNVRFADKLRIEKMSCRRLSHHVLLSFCHNKFGIMGTIAYQNKSSLLWHSK